MAIIGAAVIGAGASLAASSGSSKASAAAAQAQLEAARLQTLVARELHDHWKAYYLPCDIAFVQEVCATPVYVPNYEAVSARSRMTVLSSFGRARQQLIRCQDTYCVGTYAQNCNFLAGIEAIALADAVNYGYRREEAMKIQRDQIRFENIRTVLAQGRNLITQSSNASNIAAGIAARTGAQAGQQSNGWLQFAGFLRTPEGQKLTSSASAAFARLFDKPQETYGSSTYEGGLDPNEAGQQSGGGGGNAYSDAGPQAYTGNYPSGTQANYGRDWAASADSE